MELKIVMSALHNLGALRKDTVPYKNSLAQWERARVRAEKYMSHFVQNGTFAPRNLGVLRKNAVPHR